MLVTLLLRDRRGAQKLEYIIVLGLCALLAFAGIRFFGDRLRDAAERQAERVRTLEGAEAGEYERVRGGVGEQAEVPAALAATGDDGLVDELKGVLSAVAQAAPSPDGKAMCFGKQCVNGSCFAAGTPVVTERGTVAIEALRPGDRVLSKDIEGGTTRLRRVVRTFVTADRELWDVQLEGAGGRVETLAVTPEHRVWIEGEGWLPIAEVEVGDRALDARGQPLRVSGVQARRARETVYNFEVDEDHNYFVGHLGALVHNECTPLPTDPYERAMAAFGKGDTAARDAIERAILGLDDGAWGTALVLAHPEWPKFLETDAATKAKVIAGAKKFLKDLDAKIKDKPDIFDAPFAALEAKAKSGDAAALARIADVARSGIGLAGYDRSKDFQKRAFDALGAVDPALIAEPQYRALEDGLQIFHTEQAAKVLGGLAARGDRTAMDLLAARASDKDALRALVRGAPWFGDADWDVVVGAAGYWTAPEEARAVLDEAMRRAEPGALAALHRLLAATPPQGEGQYRERSELEQKQRNAVEYLEKLFEYGNAKGQPLPDDHIGPLIDALRQLRARGSDEFLRRRAHHAVHAVTRFRSTAFERKAGEALQPAHDFVRLRTEDIRRRFREVEAKVKAAGEIGEISQEAADKLRKEILDLSGEVVLDNRAGSVVHEGRLITGDNIVASLVALAQERNRSLGQSYDSDQMRRAVRNLLTLNDVLTEEAQRVSGLVMSKDERLKIEQALVLANREKFQKVIDDEAGRLGGAKKKIVDAWESERYSILGSIADAPKFYLGVSGKDYKDSSWYSPGRIWSNTLGIDSDKEFLAVGKRIATLDEPFAELERRQKVERWHAFWDQVEVVIKQLGIVGEDVNAYLIAAAAGKDFLTSAAAVAVAAALALPSGGQSLWLTGAVALGSGAATKAGLSTADKLIAGQEVTAGGVTRDAIFGGLDGLSIFAGGQLSSAARNAIGKRVGLQLVEKGLAREVSLQGANIFQRLAVHGVTATTRGGTFGGIVGGGRATVIHIEQIAQGKKQLGFQTLGEIGLATLEGTLAGATIDLALTGTGHGLLRLVRGKPGAGPLTEAELWKFLGGEGAVTVEGANKALAKRFPEGVKAGQMLTPEQASALEAYAELVKVKQWTKDIVDVRIHRPEVRPTATGPNAPPSLDDLIKAQGLEGTQAEALRGFVADLERVTKRITAEPAEAATELASLIEGWKKKGIQFQETEPLRIGGSELDRIAKKAQQYADELGNKELAPEIAEQLAREKFESILHTHVGKTYFVDPKTGVVHVPKGIVVERAGKMAPLAANNPIERVLSELHARGVAEEFAHGAGFGVRPGGYVPLSPRVAQFEAWLKTPEAREWLSKKGFSADEIAEMPSKIHEADAMELFTKHSRYSEAEIGRYRVRQAYQEFVREPPPGAASAPLGAGGALPTTPVGATAGRAHHLYDEIASGRIPRSTSPGELMEAQAVALERVRKLFDNKFGDDGALLDAVGGKRGAYGEALGRADTSVGASRPIAQQQREALRILLRTFQGTDAGDVALRTAVLEKLGKMGTRGDVEAILGHVRKAPTSTDLYQGLEAIKGILGRRGSPQARGPKALPRDVQQLLQREALTEAERARVIEQVLQHGEIASVKQHKGTNMNEVYFVTFKDTVPGPDGVRIPIKGVFKPENTYPGKEKAFFSREVSAYEFDRDFARTGRVPPTVEVLLSHEQSPGSVKPFGTGSMQYMIPNAEALGENAVTLKPKFREYLATPEGKQQLGEIKSLLYVLNDPDKLPNPGGFKTPNWGNIMAVPDAKKPGGYRLFMIDNGGGQRALGKSITGEMLPSEVPARVGKNVGGTTQEDIRRQLTPLIGEDAAADVAGRAAKLGAPKSRPRAGAVDEGPRKPTGPPQALLPNGKPATPDHFGGGFHGTDIPPEVAIEGRGLPGRGPREQWNWDLAQHAEDRQPPGKTSAFRGTTHGAADPTGNGNSASDWAGEGGWVYEIDGVPTWDVNKHLEHAIDVGNGLKRSNVMRGENEGAIAAEVPRERIRRYGRVIESRTGVKYVKDWIDNPHYLPREQAALIQRAQDGVPDMVKRQLQSGGSTFGIQQGEQLGGKPFWAVSPYKKLERVLPAKTTAAELEAEVSRFISDNQKLLAEPGHSVGLWKNPQTGEHYLDVTITTPNQADAHLIGAANAQEAVFNLGTGKMEPLPGGTLYKSRSMEERKVDDGVRQPGS